jgi:tRNA(Met) cytidine acetyltransferase
MLSELFGLLVIAHYRTCPSDLRVLLDSPNISIFAIRYNGHVVATALLAEEGKLDKDLAKQIYQGHRRPRGHLIPQSLVFHSGIEEAATYRYGRVMRIAVHPALQRRGIGSYLLSTLAARLKNDGFDFIGASFGVTEELLRFWKNLNYNTVRIGLKREHTSGEHSAIVLHALNAESESLLNLTRNRFYRSFPVLLSESLRDLDVSLVTELMYRKDFNEKQRLDYYDWRDITTYAYASRGFEFCLAPIWELVYTAFSTVKIEEILQPLERDALIVKILQKRSWQSTAALLNLSGRAEVEKILRKALQHLFVKIAGKDLQEEIDKQISSQPV